MKSLKTVHSLFGIILLALGLLSGIILMQLYPLVYPGYSAAQLLAQPTTLLLISAGSVNLLLGAYLNTPKAGIRSLSIVTGSLLILIASLMIAAERFGRLDSALNAQLLTPAVLLMAAGAVMQYLAHLSGIKLPSLPNLPARSNEERETGEVKWFNVSKGFGFITRDSGDDVFVHFRAIRGEGHRTLTEGQRVEFIVTRRDKGLQAEDVVGI